MLRCRPIDGLRLEISDNIVAQNLKHFLCVIRFETIPLFDLLSTLQIRSNALIKRGSLKMQNGDQSAALDDFATAAREDAENSDIYHHRGQVCASP